MLSNATNQPKSTVELGYMCHRGFWSTSSISKLVRYARACSSYECFILRAARLSSKLLGQGYVRERLKSSLGKFYGRYIDLIKRMLHDILGHEDIQWHLQLIRHYTNLWTYYRPGPYYQFRPYHQISGGFHRTLQEIRLVIKGRLLLRTPDPVPFGTCIRSNVETLTSWPCHVFGLWILDIPRYFYFP